MLWKASDTDPANTANLQLEFQAGPEPLLRDVDQKARDLGLVREPLEHVTERLLDVLELRREVCLVPQLPALLDGTVADNIRYAAGLWDRTPDVSRLLDLAGLDASYADRDSSKLSVGEQQRAMLARALAVEPDVLLLDEPTSALDEQARDSVEAALVDLSERVEISRVIVTHDLDQARRMSDWVVRLDRGHTVEQGPARELLPA